MTPKRLLARTVTLILTVVSFHIMGIELLIVFIMAPSMNEFFAMILYPLPLAMTLIFIYIVITYYFIKPILLLLKEINGNISSDTGLIRLAQNRCINLSYFLSALSFPAYILGGAGGVWIVGYVYPHWPAYILIYGLIAGIIAGLLTIPMSEYATPWAIRPVLDLITQKSPGFESARSAGIIIPLRLKLVILVVVMVIGIAGYTAIITYSLADTGIKNMRRMEQLLPAESSALLADASSGSTDTRVKSSAYFKSRMGNLKMFFVGIILVGALLSLAVAFAAANAITRPLRLFGEVAEKIKNSHYNETIKIISNDELAGLGESFNRMTATLLSHLARNQELIKSITDAVDTLGFLSQELLSIADQQASGSIQQATATEEAEETGRGIAETARQIAENAAHLARNSQHTEEITREGQQRLDETGIQLEEIDGKMKHIAHSVMLLRQQSMEINDIVEAIKKISGKTNILSLNAGIEAIKAGEAGTRFGVVAEEIRRLAQDTGKSAKRIRKNIERIQESVAMAISFAQTGEQSVNEGKTAMRQMTAQFDEIAGANAAAVRDLEKIESMTARQAETNDRLSRILSQIKLTAQNTSASSEQTHSSIKILKTLINQLKSQIRAYHQQG